MQDFAGIKNDFSLRVHNVVYIVEMGVKERGIKNRVLAIHARRIVYLITSDLRVSGVLTVRDNKDIHSCLRASVVRAGDSGFS